MKISVAVTTYNRYESTIQSIEKILNDDRVNDVQIVDDFSQDGSYEKLIEFYKDYDKVYVHQQLKNVNMSLNKKTALSLCHMRFALIADSDNVFDIDYLDTIELLGELDENTIYQPCMGIPNFSWTKHQGIVIDKSSIAQYMDDALFRSSLNGSNYVVNVANYLNRYVYNPEIDSADTIFMLLNWLKAGSKYYIVPGLKYFHKVGEQSHFLKKIDLNMRHAIQFENEIKNLK